MKRLSGTRGNKQADFLERERLLLQPLRILELIPNPVAVAELAVEKGATQLLMPISSQRQLLDLPDERATKVNIVFYSDPADAFLKSILE